MIALKIMRGSDGQKQIACRQTMQKKYTNITDILKNTS